MNGPATLVSKGFVDLTDPRADRVHNHDLLEMVVITLTATICVANGWADVERFAIAQIDWFGRCLRLDNGVPCHDRSCTSESDRDLPLLEHAP